jgi:hypothetical protein
MNKVIGTEQRQTYHLWERRSSSVKKHPLVIFAVLSILALFPACATIPSSGIAVDPSSGRRELTEQFTRGEARLECYVSCAGKYGANRPELKILHDTARWQDLALRVLEIGYYSDQPYYYLGRAAEGLGHLAAAEIYYKLSIDLTNSTHYQCDGLSNICDGFVFPKAAELRLAGILPTEAPPPRPSRPKITYSQGEPEGYKNFKWGMTTEETREFRPAMGSGELYGRLPFGDSIGPVRVTVSLSFSPPGRVEPESTLSSISLSFDPNDYETLKKIFIERYGKPISSQHEPYKTLGGAESTNEILMWKGPHSFIRLSRFGDRITEGSALMGTNESLEEFLKKRDEEIKDAAKGL